MLGFEDHGLMTCMLYLDFGGISQGFGGYHLKGVAMYETVSEILKVVGVEKWEDLKGEYIRVGYKEKEGHGRIHKIGNLLKDEWFCPEEFYKQK